jgi:opacity protein-like surface antigen
MIALALAISTTVATAAMSQDNPEAPARPSNYLALKAGIYTPSDSYDLKDYYDSNRSHLDGKTGFNGELAVGHYFLPFLAVEIGAGYFESKGSPDAHPGNTKLKVVPVVATGKILLPLGPVEPYGLFGAGAYFTRLDVHGNAGNFGGSSDITYGLHAGAGLNVNLTENLFLGVEGKYLWAKPSFGGQDIKLDGFTTTADLGLRF